MYVSKKNREIIRLKFGGKCAYSGTDLEPDWQIDHIKPVVRNWFDGTMTFEKDDCIENMVPVQKIINHYKHSLNLEVFRTWLLAGLHNRLKKLPKNPRTEKGQKRKDYLLKVALYFGITEDKPFSGKFYFETVTPSQPEG
jgi:5-methylcytosine-specific restriction endonuclease McrA